MRLLDPKAAQQTETMGLPGLLAVVGAGKGPSPQALVVHLSMCV